ncbi:hypothetical protein LUZ61_003992 [Rhynchospora tenuis]|uniref:Uncharacterized protein n=1 Tax=Rhynchospora tenuis TaxID=198213 RepID=A0AAD6ET67_9POAL|nr:hypothetical protein LUZ61_003992 [Rhynchospora tenuis]
MCRLCTWFWKMARIPRSRRLAGRHIRSASYPAIPLYRFKAGKPINSAQTLKKVISHKKKRCDWEDATCSVCMEYPHNAVLLLCSSHEKGCRPYMCGTSYRHSNCLDQFKKASSKSCGLGSQAWTGSEKPGSLELTCPLCRGQVKGWTVVEPARKYLDNKRRTCMQEGCSFVGTYRELRKHVKVEHPSAKPREVDPAMEQKWRTLEHERERQDVISTIRSSMPRAVVFGDYVIEMGESDEDNDDDSYDEEGPLGNEAGDRAGVDGARRGVNRSILYFFLREGARFMRFNNDNENREESAGFGLAPATGNNTADLASAYSLDGDDDDDEDDDDVDDAVEVVNGFMGHARGVGPFGSERRRRRRRRSRGGIGFVGPA